MSRGTVQGPGRASAKRGRGSSNGCKAPFLQRPKIRCVFLLACTSLQRSIILTRHFLSRFLTFQHSQELHRTTAKTLKSSPRRLMKKSWRFSRAKLKKPTSLPRMQKGVQRVQLTKEKRKMPTKRRTRLQVVLQSAGRGGDTRTLV